MQKKHSGWLVFFFLMAILLFVVGIRLGKKIEQIDQKIKANQTPSPTPAFPPYSFKKFVSVPCKIQFLYPALFKEFEQSTDEAKLTYQNQLITVYCGSGKSLPSRLRDFLSKKASMKPEGTETIKKVEVTLYPSESANTALLFFEHPKTKQPAIIRVPKNLLPLFSATVEFNE